MAQSTPAYNPQDILAAGQRAEAEGRAPYAVQFYRHLTDYYANTPEAHEARAALHRINSAASQDPRARRSLASALEAHTAGPAENGHAGHGANGDHYGYGHATPPQAGVQPTWAPAPVETPAPRQQALVPVSQRESRPAVSLPAPARSYALGRLLAWMLSLIGGLIAIGGVAALGYGFSRGFGPANAMGMTVLTAGASLIGTGLVLLLFGQIALAVFRTANATVDLAAISRARHEAGEG